MQRAAILRAVLRSHYNQPATALWRTLELETVLHHIGFHGRILDLGCGDSGIGSIIMPPSSMVTGLDISLTDLRVARATARYPRLCLGDSNTMPFADSTFDMVFSNSVLEHIPTIDRTLAEVGRILRPGGELAFTVPSDHFVTCLQGPARRRARGREDEAQAYIDMLDRRLQHHHYLSPSAWGRKLEQAGLCLEKHVYYLDRASLQTWERLHQWTAGIALRLVRNGHHPHERHDRWSLPVTRDVQRRWHLLAARRALPAGLIARALFVPLWQALRQARNEDRIGGCLLVIARKPTTSAPLRGVMAESEPHG